MAGTLLIGGERAPGGLPGLQNRWGVARSPAGSIPVRLRQNQRCVPRSEGIYPSAPVVEARRGHIQSGSRELDRKGVLSASINTLDDFERAFSWARKGRGLQEGDHAPVGSARFSRHRLVSSSLSSVVKLGCTTFVDLGLEHSPSQARTGGPRPRSHGRQRVGTLPYETHASQPDLLRIKQQAQCRRYPPCLSSHSVTWASIADSFTGFMSTFPGRRLMQAREFAPPSPVADRRSPRPSHQCPGTPLRRVGWRHRHSKPKPRLTGRLFPPSPR